MSAPATRIVKTTRSAIWIEDADGKIEKFIRAPVTQKRTPKPKTKTASQKRVEANTEVDLLQNLPQCRVVLNRLTKEEIENAIAGPSTSRELVLSQAKPMDRTITNEIRLLIEMFSKDWFGTGYSTKSNAFIDDIVAPFVQLKIREANILIEPSTLFDMQLLPVNKPNNQNAPQLKIDAIVFAGHRINIRGIHSELFGNAIEVELFCAGNERHCLIFSAEMWFKMVLHFITWLQRIGGTSPLDNHLNHRVDDMLIAQNNVESFPLDSNANNFWCDSNVSIQRFIDCALGSEHDNRFTENPDEIAETTNESLIEYEADVSNEMTDTATSSDDSFLDEEERNKRLYILYHKQPKNE